MDNLTYLSNADSAYVDGLYQSYKQDPQSVDFGWQKFFEGFDFGQNAGGTTSSVGEATPEHVLKEINVLNMINGYRDRGHLFTHTNPVRERRKYYPGKELETFGLAEADMNTVFNAGVEVGLGPATLKDIRQLVEDTYCRSIGAEFKYIRNPEKIKWLQDRMEADRNMPKFSLDTKKRILNKLNHAVVFENFLGTKFLGQKRFSLEGAESLIPALDSVIEKGAEIGIQEFVIGMAHRGRLNVLTNIMGKSYKSVFSEFEGKTYADDPEVNFGGDVKYHLGFSSEVKTNDGKSVHLSLAPNPSHLETVDPIVEGMVRSKIDFKYEGDSSKIAPIIIHGDAAIAGQGVVYEVTQMSKLDGYKTGGTVHIVINNQIGFTTNYKDARSGTYCTDVAKITSSPVFHVNGDDAEAVVYAINLAVEYRQKYKTDVFIDLLCYRRFGHNEADEPKFTQPLLYKIIEKHPNPKEVYAKKLITEGSIDEAYSKNIEKEFKAELQTKFEESKTVEVLTEEIPMFKGAWEGLRPAKKGEVLTTSDKTKVAKDLFLKLAKEITTLPSDKKFFRKITRLFEDRAKMITADSYDWAMGELMAYATLLDQGNRVRISGQDVQRGTFSHRHAVLTLEDSEEKYVPLANIKGGDKFSIYNSLLSEYAVLGFEYGYASSNPNSLTIWEAQFGDFYNGAQIIVDQYLSSAETKWKRSNGLVMMLPHGMEGQGPEHSSARIERFLELCADENMILANCTTPANYFHLLRRQLVREFRKPLVVFTPKSLLRHPKVVSPLKDFTEAAFQEVIDDANVAAKDVKRVLFCSGKVYYDLLEKQETDKRKDIAIVRLEQLFPIPTEQLKAIRKKYNKAKEFVWVQEENENMGAWSYYCRKLMGTEIAFTGFVARKESGSTATGYMKQHVAQQAEILNKSFE
ncbi:MULTISPECIES: 2-oxoglutarate dehydrogenase E1 component [Sphingobacterium]|jgi:2-oxoglutarate dehydrogenase E1 component|uniref:oxoglutarate dehydrogenase (succinyl-transferring) n=4 Tax=Sphingobacterium TaxID=28453 RepID=A0A420G4P3_9SPHI|nr:MULTISPECIES: 2-oxoglutarate dehydrogenase E1 component [Sphingobacterium]HAF36118.1 2-oxoglutarate dehydrogenase E1 component [Sphingobacterium sp.]APU99023.1 2-oxoglutarate dehydrogenase E1 component [Sphingobacterium sp. B29]OFV18347.1 2-oxoglutarate dehydrogenase subunit E1 [Sphingobacterium sp. HMSC13C05]QQT29996.1 2-oxoglutarate dehydrogenase E1 component [Sphingobacterium multivorum]QQT59982.1 2-oxoglutarate dehydrogenase E1 component [Sphingobacterium multivorum]